MHWCESNERQLHGAERPLHSRTLPPQPDQELEVLLTDIFARSASYDALDPCISTCLAQEISTGMISSLSSVLALNRRRREWPLKILTGASCDSPPATHRTDMSLLPALAAWSGAAAVSTVVSPTTVPAGVSTLVCPGTTFVAPPAQAVPRPSRATIPATTLTLDYSVYRRPLSKSYRTQGVSKSDTANWAWQQSDILYDWRGGPDVVGHRVKGRPEVRYFEVYPPFDDCITRADAMNFPLLNSSLAAFGLVGNKSICGTDYTNIDGLMDKVFDHYDVNGDALLTESEFDAAFLFGFDDIDQSNGQISQSEAETHWQKYAAIDPSLMTEFSSYFFSIFDSDNDGSIIPGVEFEQAFNYGANPPSNRVLSLPNGWGDDQVYHW